MSQKLRPGVYASYEVRDDSDIDKVPSQLVGIAAAADEGEAGLILGTSQAVEAYGECSLTRLIRCAIENGATRIYAVPVKNGGYAEALSKLCTEHDAKILCCDANDEQTQQSIKSLLDENSALLYRILVLEAFGEAEALTERANDLNCENIVLLAGKGSETGCLSAALAGLMSCREDPALPLNGEALGGVGTAEIEFTDAETELLLQNGVTPLEHFLDNVCIVRCVSTRTMTNGVYDASYRDINTVMVINHVLPKISDMLNRDYKGKKSGSYTKAAISSAVENELKKLLRSEIIADYGKITVRESETETGVCVVSFEFSVARGLHIIELCARLDM